MFASRIHLDVKLLVAGALAALAGLVGLAGFTSSAQASIYWISGGGPSGSNIGTAKANGTDVIPSLVNIPGGPGAPFLQYLGVKDAHLYWVASVIPDGGTPQGKLFRAGLDGTDPVEILDGGPGTNFGAIGFSSDKLFLPRSTFVDGGEPDGSILRADLNGTDLELDFINKATLGGFPIFPMAMDSEHIYYTLPANGPEEPSRIGKVGIDGSDPNPNLLSVPDNFPTQIAVAGGKIFWTESTPGFGPEPPPPSTKVFVADTNGSNKDEIATGSTGVEAVAADETYVYWGTNQGKIGRSRHDGTDINADFITGAAPTPGPPIRGLATGGGTPGPTPTPKARLGKVTVSGPGTVKRGKTVTWKVKIPNIGEATATGVRVAVSGRGVRLTTRFSNIAAGKSRTELIRAKLRKVGKFTATFKVTTKDAGTKTVSKSVRVRK